jgi:hypothetical protein
MIVRVAPITRRGQHDKSVGSIRGFFVWNSELRNASMPQLARMWISSGKTAGRAGSGVRALLGRMYADRGLDYNADSPPTSAKTKRIIPILAVAIMIGPSLANGSPACMTEREARAKFPKAHLVWVGTNHC